MGTVRSQRTWSSDYVCTGPLKGVPVHSESVRQIRESEIVPSEPSREGFRSGGKFFCYRVLPLDPDSQILRMSLRGVPGGTLQSRDSTSKLCFLLRSLAMFRLQEKTLRAIEDAPDRTRVSWWLQVMSWTWPRKLPGRPRNFHRMTRPSKAARMVLVLDEIERYVPRRLLDREFLRVTGYQEVA